MSHLNQGEQTFNRHYGDYNNSPAGLIPSPELQEWRIATNAIEKAKDGTGMREEKLRSCCCCCCFFVLLIFCYSMNDKCISNRHVYSTGKEIVSHENSRVDDDVCEIGIEKK